MLVLQLNLAKAKADEEWMLPQIEGLPDGLYIAGQDLSGDGFAPQMLGALVAAAAIVGPQHWLRLIPILGGIRKTLKLLITPPKMS